VTVYLPISQEQAKPAPKAPPGLAMHQAAVRGARVLLVDDDDDVRRFVSELLGECGCVVRAEADGMAALAALEDGDFDLMVLDFAMPGMTGAEVARVVRERRQGLPMLIMTGYLEHEAVLAQLGAQPILQKPFEAEELLARIVAALPRQTETSI
jgi:DNA-binding response OmpR family regulator